MVQDDGDARLWYNGLMIIISHLLSILKESDGVAMLLSERSESDFSEVQSDFKFSLHF